ncbi:MAG: hypothetical protein IPI83_14490 [Sphingomonadales bacterium]|nr:hypothetical protein [Sphingomonadales bacterium]
MGAISNASARPGQRPGRQLLGQRVAVGEGILDGLLDPPAPIVVERLAERVLDQETRSSAIPSRVVWIRASMMLPPQMDGPCHAIEQAGMVGCA